MLCPRAGKAVARLATAVTLAVVSAVYGLAACGGPEDSYSIAIAEPAALAPGAARTTAGLRVVDALFTGLVRYDLQSGQPELAVAESIESTDQRHWTITIEEGWTFHNGEPVTAENFVRAWNATAYGPNGRAGNELFARVEGYEKLNPPGGSGGRGGQAESRKLPGLRIVDDYTFRVTLAEPFSQFPVMLAHPAFLPLPKVAFRDLEAFNRQPIGNGPYALAGRWSRGQDIELTRYEDYGAEGEARVANLTYRTYPDRARAYRAVREGAADILPSVPQRLLTRARDDFGDRFVFRPGSTFVYLGLPRSDGRLDDPRLRRALSMAIDREEMVRTVLAEVPAPAKSLVSPLVPDGRQAPCGGWCEYQPQRAQQLFRAAGGYEGTLRLSYRGGEAQRAVAGGLARMLRQNLGLDVELHPRSRGGGRQAETPDTGGTARPGRPATGASLARWRPRYLSPQAYLQPLYTSRGEANRTGYASTRVDVLVRKGNRASSIDAALDHYRHAEDIVLGDMPVVPLWFRGFTAVHSPSVESVVLDITGHVQVARVRAS